MPDRTRRLSPPWTVGQIACGYKVKDASGQAPAFVYGRETRADANTKLVTLDEARRITSAVTKLPTLSTTH